MTWQISEYLAIALSIALPASFLWAGVPTTIIDLKAYPEMHEIAFLLQSQMLPELCVDTICTFIEQRCGLNRAMKAYWAHQGKSKRVIFGRVCVSMSAVLAVLMASRSYGA